MKKKKKKATKVGAIVGGQTSCKAPELSALDEHLPRDVEIVSCHSLHGPKVNPRGQPLVCKMTRTVRGKTVRVNNMPRFSSSIGLRTRALDSWKRCSHALAPNTFIFRARCMTASQQTRRQSHTRHSLAWGWHGKPTTSSRGKYHVGLGELKRSR